MEKILANKSKLEDYFPDYARYKIPSSGEYKLIITINLKYLLEQGIS